MSWPWGSKRKPFGSLTTWANRASEGCAKLYLSSMPGEHPGPDTNRTTKLVSAPQPGPLKPLPIY